jgi:hypothetical protein
MIKCVCVFYLLNSSHGSQKGFQRVLQQQQQQQQQQQRSVT